MYLVKIYSTLHNANKALSLPNVEVFNPNIANGQQNEERADWANDSFLQFPRICVCDTTARTLGCCSEKDAKRFKMIFEKQQGKF